MNGGIHRIKIDAQGAEGRIFEAGRKLLKRDKPLIILELWPDGLRSARPDPTVLLDRLAGPGYHRRATLKPTSCH